MTFLELARARYSVRQFKKDALEEEKLAAILEAGRRGSYKTVGE